MIVVVLTLLIVGLIAGLLWSHHRFPYKSCGRCGGNGKRHSPMGGGWRMCKPCDGTGRELRLFANTFRSAGRRL